MKAYVNSDGCISCGLCVNLCPEVFKFDDEDKSYAYTEKIPDNCVETAVEARDGCPVSVIDIEE